VATGCLKRAGTPLEASFSLSISISLSCWYTMVARSAYPSGAVDKPAELRAHRRLSAQLRLDLQRRGALQQRGQALQRLAGLRETRRRGMAGEGGHCTAVRLESNPARRGARLHAAAALRSAAQRPLAVHTSGAASSDAAFASPASPPSRSDSVSGPAADTVAAAAAAAQRQTANSAAARMVTDRARAAQRSAPLVPLVMDTRLALLFP
jgi:hypothetical protein